MSTNRLSMRALTSRCRGTMTFQSLLFLLTFLLVARVGYCILPMYYDAYEIVHRIQVENKEHPFEAREVAHIEAAVRLLIAHQSRAVVDIQSIQIIKNSDRIQIAFHYTMKRRFIGSLSFIADFSELIQVPKVYAYP